MSAKLYIVATHCNRRVDRIYASLLALLSCDAPQNDDFLSTQFKEFMNKLFTSSGYHAFDVLALESGGALDFRQLPPFLRVLLTTDGTVTKILESYFWEPVDVQCRNQGLAPATQEHMSLGLSVGDELLEREVLLLGKQSGKVYAKANSFVCLSRLPSGVREALLSKRMGIGEIVRESGLETYRELISIDQSVNELLGDCVDRCYRILASSRPIILIKEYFPLALYSGSSVT